MPNYSRTDGVPEWRLEFPFANNATVPRYVPIFRA